MTNPTSSFGSVGIWNRAREKMPVCDDANFACRRQQGAGANFIFVAREGRTAAALAQCSATQVRPRDDPNDWVESIVIFSKG